MKVVIDCQFLQACTGNSVAVESALAEFRDIRQEGLGLNLTFSLLGNAAAPAKELRELLFQMGFESSQIHVRSFPTSAMSSEVPKFHGCQLGRLLDASFHDSLHTDLLFVPSAPRVAGRSLKEFGSEVKILFDLRQVEIPDAGWAELFSPAEADPNYFYLIGVDARRPGLAGSFARSRVLVFGEDPVLSKPLGEPKDSEQISLLLRGESSETAEKPFGLLEIFSDLLGRKSSPSSRHNEKKLRLAYVSPMPPIRSGIADCSAEIVDALSEVYDLEIVVDQEDVEGDWVKPHMPIRSVEWLEENAWNVDRILYHFGNSHYHRHMLDLLERWPGVVVLHDLSIGHVLRQLEHDGRRAAWRDALIASHGYSALLEFCESDSPHTFHSRYPCSYDVICSAVGIVTHNNFAKQIAGRFYGVDFGGHWESAPLPRRAVSFRSRGEARMALGLDDGEFVIATFGHIGPHKMVERLIEAWEIFIEASGGRGLLVFAGECGDSFYREKFLKLLERSPCRARMRITGFLDQQTYRDYLSACDGAIQLRSGDLGETSAAALDALAAGRPLIVNAHGFLAELPEKIVVRIPDQFSNEELIGAFRFVADGGAAVEEMSLEAARYVLSQHDPKRSAHRYAELVEQFYAESPRSRRPKMIQKIAEQLPDAREIRLTAARIHANELLLSTYRKNLFIDVTEISQRDLRTGIQRVCRNIVRELILGAPKSLGVFPFYIAPDGNFRHARRYTAKLLGADATGLSDEPLMTSPGDVMLWLDQEYEILNRMETVIAHANRGVRMVVCLYDLLPIEFPKYFPPESEIFGRWLDAVGGIADQFICISQATATSARQWVSRRMPERENEIEVSSFLLGSEIEEKAEGGASEEILIGNDHPTFLMVGTIEPRKGHRQALDAFTALWASGFTANLVICGKQGWMMESLCEAIMSHPECGKRLFWFSGLKDSTLESLYRRSCATIMASEGEGFGLPIVESAKFGTPVIARDIPVFREVAGEGASYFSGSSSEALAAALRDWMELFRAGRVPRPEGINAISWADSARDLLRSMDLLVESKEESAL